VFRGGNPDAGSGTVSLATVLDAALSRVEHDLAGTPATQAPLMATLAKVLFVIGQPDRGQQLFTRAIELERGQQRPLVLAEMLLGNAYELRRDRFSQIDHDAVLEAVQLVEAHAAAGSPLHLELLLSAASTLGQVGRTEADALFERSLQEAREHHPGSVALANALGAYGWHQRRQEDYPRAIALMRESLELRGRLLGDAHIEYVTQLEALAGTLQLARRLSEAEPLFREALDLHRRHGRLASRQGAWSLVQYATLLSAAGRASEAFPFFDEAFAIGRQKFPEDNGAFSVWTHNLADTVAAIGDVPRATALVEDAIATMRTQGPAAHRRLARSLVLKSRILRQNGCHEGAGAAVDEALAVFSTLPSPDPLDLSDARLVRALWLLDCRRLDEADRVLATLSTPQSATRPGASLQIAQATALAALWRDGDGPAHANLIEAEQALAADFAPGDPRAALVRLSRAEWLHAQGRHSEASTLATAMLDQIGDRLVADAALRRRLAALRTTR
jgi:eukaryotic-like serine/threonine-protein kinase